MTIIVHPFEGIGITAGGGWSSGHQGQDYQTPRIYDYTAPSDGVVEYVGGTYNSIIVLAPNGVRWRLAEVAIILVKKGEQVRRGQVIGRNSLYRGGIYRSPHLNGGGDTARRPFTEIVTHTKAAAAAIDAAASQAEIRKRTVKKTVNATRRTGPGTSYNKTGEMLLAGTVGNFVAFAHGPASQGQPVGNDVWFKGISGDWFWSGSFTSQSTAGLIDLTADFANVVIILPPVVEVPEPNPEPEPEAPEGPVEPGPIEVIPTPGEEPPVIIVPDPEPGPTDPTDPSEPPVVIVVPPVVPDPSKPDEPVGYVRQFINFIISLLRTLFGVR